MKHTTLKIALLSGTSVLVAQSTTAHDAGTLSASADTEYSPNSQHDDPEDLWAWMERYETEAAVRHGHSSWR